MNEASVKINLYSLRQDDVRRVKDRTIAVGGPSTYQLQLIHGCSRGTSLHSMIRDWHPYDAKVKRITPGDSPEITFPVLKEPC